MSLMQALRRILVSFLIGLATPLVVHAECSAPNTVEFEAYREQVGLPFKIIPRHIQDANKAKDAIPYPKTPFNREFTVELVLPADRTFSHFTAFGRRHVKDPNQDDTNPVPLEISSQKKEGAKLILDLKLTKDWSLRVKATRYALLILGCESIAQNETYVVLANFERAFSPSGSGWLWFGIALLVLVGGFRLYIMSSWKELNEDVATRGGMRVDKWHCVKLAFSGPNYGLSLTKVQLAIFFVAVILALAYAYGRTGALSDLSMDVLQLLGITVASATVATLSDRYKARLDWPNWVWLSQTRRVIRSPEKAKPRFKHLVSTNGEFDVSRFQALAFTLLVAPSFAIASVYSLGAASIPDGILYILGLSQAAYVAGKAVAPPMMQDFNKQVIEYRNMVQTGLKLKKTNDGTPTYVKAKPMDLYAAAQAVKHGFHGSFGYRWNESNDAGNDLPSKVDMEQFAMAGGYSYSDVENAVNDLTEADMDLFHEKPANVTSDDKVGKTAQ